MELREFTPFQAFCRSVAMVIMAAPIEVRKMTILMFFDGAVPGITLWLNKVIIDKVGLLLQQGISVNLIPLIAPRDFYHEYILLILSIIGVLLLNLLRTPISTITRGNASYFLIKTKRDFKMT